MIFSIEIKMEKCVKVAALYVAALRALALINQFSHWTNKGISFFGNHLMYEKLYNSALEDADLAAEKFVGIFGAECLDYQLQTELINKCLSKYNNFDTEPGARSLKAERDFIKFSKDAYECFEREGRLTLGLDDMIMAISSKREESVYHLQQTFETAAM